MMPRHIEMVAQALPRLGNGKIDRTSIIERAKSVRAA
jgi:hypothetical protein